MRDCKLCKKGVTEGGDLHEECLIADRDKYKAEVEMLRGVGCSEEGDGPCGVCLKCHKAMVKEALGMVEHWGSYAGEYFQEKWDLKEDVQKLRDFIAEKKPEEGAT